MFLVKTERRFHCVLSGREFLLQSTLALISILWAHAALIQFKDGLSLPLREPAVILAGAEHTRTKNSVHVPGLPGEADPKESSLSDWSSLAS